MNVYTIFLFVHVLGAIGYSTGTLVSLFGLTSLRGARTVEQARSILGLLERIGPLSGISLLVTIIAGLYMAITTWGRQAAWINVTMATLVLLLAMGVLMGTRRHKIALLLKDMPDGPLPESVEQRIYDPWMAMGVYMLVTLLVGVVFLMTVKPALSGSLLVIGISVVLGLVLSLPGWLNARRVIAKG